MTQKLHQEFVIHYVFVLSLLPGDVFVQQSVQVTAHQHISGCGPSEREKKEQDIYRLWKFSMFNLGLICGVQSRLDGSNGPSTHERKRVSCVAVVNH